MFAFLTHYFLCLSLANGSAASIRNVIRHIDRHAIVILFRRWRHYDGSRAAIMSHHGVNTSKSHILKVVSGNYTLLVTS